MVEREQKLMTRRERKSIYNVIKVEDLTFTLIQLVKPRSNFVEKEGFGGY